MSLAEEAYKATYAPVADQYADQYGIPRNIFRALVNQESGWDVAARGAAGEIGLTQLMPGTARDLNVDPNNPMEALKGGADYLAQLFKRYGSWDNALTAYNAGMGNLDAVRSGSPTAAQSAAIAKGQAYAKSVLGAAGVAETANTANPPGWQLPPSGLTFDLSDFGIPKYDLTDPMNWALRQVQGATSAATGAVQTGANTITAATDVAGKLMDPQFWKDSFWYIIGAIAVIALVFFGFMTMLRSSTR